MKNPRRVAIIFSFFAAPLLLSIFTATSFLAIPLVYIYWLLLFISVFTVAVFQVQMFKADKYTFKLLHHQANKKMIIFIASFNEDPGMLARNLISIKNANRDGEVWLLDDSTDQKIVKELIPICEKLGVRFIHRNSRRGYKAGALNDAMALVADDYEFMTVFDSDQMPNPRFFTGIMGYFSDPKIAVVQVPQTYTSVPTNISHSAFFQQEVFLRKIMRARSGSSAFILGSGFVARISAIKSVGGFFEDNVTEDLATSILLQSKGWKIIYVDTSDIWYGRSPETVSAYIKQQGRWSLGGFQALSLMLYSNLSISAFFDYFSGWLYWLWVGPIRLFSLLSLVLFLDFRLYTILVNPIFFIIFYFPFFIYSMIFYYYTASDGLMSYGIKGFFMHQGAELLLMFTVTSSFFAYVLKRKRPFAVTPKGVAGTYSLRQAMPMISIELLVTSTISLGIIWLRTASQFLLRVAIYINVFFAVYLIPFLIAASVILFTSTYSPKNETVLLTKVQPPE